MRKARKRGRSEGKGRGSRDRKRGKRGSGESGIEREDVVQVGMKEEEKGRNEKGRQKKSTRGRGPGLKRGDVATEGLPTDLRKHTSTGLVPRKERICCLGSRTCVTKLDPPVLLISLRSEVMFVFQNRQCHFQSICILDSERGGHSLS